MHTTSISRRFLVPWQCCQGSYRCTDVITMITVTHNYWLIHWHQVNISINWFLPFGLSAGRVLSSPVSVRLSVRLSVTLFVRAITRDAYDLGLPNLVYWLTLGIRSLGLFLRGQGQRSRSPGQKMWVFFLHFGLVRTISKKVMDGFSPNLHRIWI